MKVILLKKTEKLGNEGDVVEVKDGYARNFLIPCGLGMAATDKNFNKLQEIKKSNTKKAQEQKQSFLSLKEQIEKISLTVAAEAKVDEELYGTINEAQISKLLMGENIDVSKDQIILDEPIAKLGVYSVKVNLHSEVEAALRLWVVKK